MTLADLTLPIPAAIAKGYAMVFSSALASRLSEIHAAHGSPNCVPNPARLSDGRYALCADLLTEVQPGGLLHSMWEAADKDVLMAGVEVIPMAEAEALLASP